MKRPSNFIKTDHVVERHEAAALDEREDDEAQRQRDDGCPIQQEARGVLGLPRGFRRDRFWGRLHSNTLL